MVASWLAAHRGQVPEAAWQQRVAEWTPGVSAAAWARTLAEQAESHDRPDVLLVADDDVHGVVGLVLATVPGDDPSGDLAEVGALYVLPGHQGRGVGRLLLREAAAVLRSRGSRRLRIGVLSANLPARGFYEAMGGQVVGQRTFEEEGHLLPETVYGWADLAALVVRAGPP